MHIEIVAVLTLLRLNFLGICLLKNSISALVLHIYKLTLDKL
jgi:hypothetical protein